MWLKGGLANIGNRTAMTASAQITSKTTTEITKQVEKAVVAKAEQAATEVGPEIRASGGEF